MGERRPRTITRLLRRAGPAGLLLLAVGCTADGSRAAKRDDPLLGANTAPSYQPASTAAPNPVASQPPTVATSNPGGLQPIAPPAYKPQPPLTPAMPTSNAALAGGYQPLQGGTNLRIGSDAPPAFAPPVQPVAGVTAVPPPGAPAQPATPIAVPPAGSTLDQAYAAVTTKQPLSYRMTFNSQTGEYIFQMTVPSKLNTAAVQHVEATSASPSDAIRRTLEQLN
jgi:hypothetical protein